MKKRKICILCLLLAGLLTLSGCAMLGVPQASDSSDSNASDTESPFTNRDSEITTESSTEQIVIGGEPPRYLWESFLDVENLLNYVSVVGADSEMCQYAKPEDYQSAHGWSNTMVDRIKEVGEVYVPCLADETNPFDYERASRPITMWELSIFHLPSVSYWVKNATHVEYCYIPDDWTVDKDTTVSMLFKTYYPNKPNVDNYAYDSIARVYEKEIAFADRTVSAMVYEYNTDHATEVYCIYDRLILQFWHRTEPLTDEWFSKFSLKPVTVPEDVEAIVIKGSTAYVFENMDVHLFLYFAEFNANVTNGWLDMDSREPVLFQACFEEGLAPSPELSLYLEVVPNEQGALIIKSFEWRDRTEVEYPEGWPICDCHFDECLAAIEGRTEESSEESQVE